MPVALTTVAVLGSTGSIGRSALEVIAASEGTLQAVALTAHSNTGLLKQQACWLRPRRIVVTDREAAAREDWSALPKETELLVGPEAICRVVADADVNVVLSAIVGSAGLQGTWAALEAGKTVALANKEPNAGKPASCPSIANIAPCFSAWPPARTRRSAGWC